MSNISVFRAPVSNVIPYKNVSLADIVYVIKSGKYKNITDKLRSLTTREERSKCKQNELDYATFSGTFSLRSVKYLLFHSCLIAVDIDHIGDRQAIKALQELILSLHLPALMFISPSGDGLKIVYQVDLSQGTHEQYFTALQNFFRTEFNTEIDEKCKDVSRPCFLCHDPECFSTETPAILGADFIEKYTASTPPKAAPPKSNEIITDQSLLIANLSKWIGKKLSFVNGNRNKYVSELCGAFNRFGVNEDKALENLLLYEEPGFTENEIKAIVRSIYNNKALHGIAQFEAGTEPAATLQSPAKPEPESEKAETTPPMPIDGFPDFIQQLIKECSSIYGTHQDLWTAAFFAATSSAIGQSVILKTKYENAVLSWLAVVGPSGVGKSEPLDFAFKPVHEIDFRAFEDYNRELEQFVADSSDREGNSNGPKPQKPRPCCQHIIIDSTPEALAVAMSANPRGITIMREELYGWFMDFGRYKKSGEQSTMLSIWSQKVLKVLRMGRKGEFIQDPFVNVFGGIQPELLPEIAKEHRDVNGFLSRFCFVFPDRIEAPVYNNNEISEERKTQYRQYMANLFAIEGYREEVRLSDEASRLYEDFYNKNAALNNSGKQSDYLNKVNSKLNIIVLRAALLFHYSTWACTGSHLPYISGTTMNSAIQLTEYFRTTAGKVYKMFNPAGTDKKELAKHLISLGNSQALVAQVLNVTQQYISKIVKQ